MAPDRLIVPTGAADLPTWDEILVRLKAAVESATLRVVAEQVPVGASTLYKHLNGTVPVDRLARAYAGWWFAHGQYVPMPDGDLPIRKRGPPGPASRDIAAAVAQLQEGLAEPTLAGARRRMSIAIVALGGIPGVHLNQGA
jgi:hypothetical protein